MSSSSIGRIYSYPGNWRVRRVRAVAVWSGSDVVETALDPGLMKTEPWATKFPLGSLPAFETHDGTVHITESAAMAEYVARTLHSDLIPSDPALAAQVSMWCDVADQELVGMLTCPFGMNAGFIPYQAGASRWFLDKLEARLKSLDTVLEGKTYLVGDRLSLADIFVATVLSGLHAFPTIIDREMRDKVPNLMRNFWALVNVLGEPTLIDVRALPHPYRGPPGLDKLPAPAFRAV